MNDLNMPVTPNLLKDWADQALRRTNPEALGVGKNWPYRFMKRLPKELNLRRVKQKVKEDKRIQAEDSGLLAHWYDQLEVLLRDVPARLVYNMDECGFCPG
jgi:hypothetical protein